MNYLVKDIAIVNEGKTVHGDVLITNGRVEKIASVIDNTNNVKEINGHGQYLLPGVIDDQVHFREPGLTHKVISYRIKSSGCRWCYQFHGNAKYDPAGFDTGFIRRKIFDREKHIFSELFFFHGTSNENADEVLHTNDKKDRVCGVKIFMGSSTGNLLVNNSLSLEKIFFRI
jgi:dihydroorotase